MCDKERKKINQIEIMANIIQGNPKRYFQKRGKSEKFQQRVNQEYPDSPNV